MKIRIIILMLVSSISFLTFSCSNDDDNNNGSDTSIPLVGQWNISKVGTTVAGQEVLTDPPQNENGCSKDYLQFNADNTLIAGDYDSSNSPCELQTQSGTYARTGNQLVTVIDGTNRTQEILNLTATELKVKDESGAIVVFVRA